MRFGMTKTQWRILIALGIADFVVITALACIVITSMRAPVSSQMQLPAPPISTNTLPPTWTPVLHYTATPDLAFSIYIATVQSELEALGSEMETLSYLMEEGGTTYLSEDWYNRVIRVLTDIDVCVATLRAIQPPAVARACHAHLLTSLDHCNLMTAYLSYGITANDTNAILQSFTEVDIASTNLDTYVTCISRLP